MVNPEWPDTEARIDIIGSNGNDGDHYGGGLAEMNDLKKHQVAEVKQLFQPSNEIIRTLESLLEEAKRGELKALAFACVYAESIGAQGWSTEAGIDRDKILARIVRLQAMFTAEFGD